MTKKRSADAEPMKPIAVRPAQAAQMLSLSLSTIYNLKDRGLLRFQKIGSMTVISVAEIEALVAGKVAAE